MAGAKRFGAGPAGAKGPRLVLARMAERTGEGGHAGDARSIAGWLRDAFWARHASPWSAGTRILASPVLLYAIYRRKRRLLLATVAFLAVNPVLFPRPERTDNWLSRGVLAEREWIRAGNGTIDRSYPNVLNLLSAPTWLLALVAAWKRRPAAAVVATATAMVLKLSWIDAIIDRTGVAGETPAGADGEESPGIAGERR